LSGGPGADDDEVVFSGTHVRVSKERPGETGAGSKYINRPIGEERLAGTLSQVLRGQSMKTPRDLETHAGQCWLEWRVSRHVASSGDEIVSTEVGLQQS
jgi:hypothetical protein